MKLGTYATRVARSARITAWVVLACGLSGDLRAQSDSGHFYHSFGPVARAEDVDADGVYDIAIAKITSSWFISVRSGADGRAIGAYHPAQVGDSLGAAMASLGDVNGDGHADLAVSWGNPVGGGTGYVRVYSGVDGSEMFSVSAGSPGSSFGSTLDGDSDLDADGVRDLVVAAPGDDVGGLVDCGSVYAFSGADGSPLFVISGVASGAKFGSALDSLGDVNDDGHGDILVGVSGLDLYEVHSGAQPGVVLHLGMAQPGDWAFATNVAALGDLDGDGVSEFAVTAVSLLGSVRVLSGSDNSLLYTLVPPDLLSDPTYYGDSIDSARGDLDCDGVPDFIVSDPGDDFCPRRPFDWDCGAVWFYSGDDGSLIGAAYGAEFPAALGDSVAGLGDLDGDGGAEVVVGSGWGVAYLYTFGSFSSCNLANGYAGGGGSAPGFEAAGDFTPGSAVGFELAGAPPRQTGFLVGSANATYVAFKGGTLVPDADVLVPQLTSVRGDVSLMLHLPGGAPPGLVLYWQWWIQDPASPDGYSASNALQFVVQ